MHTKTLFKIISLLIVFTFTISMSAPSLSQAELLNSSNIKEATKESSDSSGDDGKSNNQADESEGDKSDKESEEQENPLNLAVEKVINSNAITSSWSEKVNEFMSKYDLNGSLVGKSTASVAILLVLLLLYFIVKKLNKVLSNKLLDTKYFNYRNKRRIKKYTKAVSWLMCILGTTFAIIALILIWHDAPQKVLSNDNFTFIVQSVFSVFFIIFIGMVILDVINHSLDLLFRKIDHRTSRINTLLTIVKNTAYFAIFLLLGLTILSELGINIFPLLAGAGVIGFAIGFGAQTLVKDIITGFIIIIEDLFQVGDVVQLGDSTGLVERVTIRKVQLRDLGGIVYTVPFSEISVIKNYTKEFSFYLMDIGISYREDTDEVIKLLKDISHELRKDEDFKDLILDDIEIFGVDQFADSAVIIKARIKTKPIQQWNVGREFNRRMKYAFDHHNIEIPFPHQTLYFGEDKDGKAPAANVHVLEEIKEQKTEKAESAQKDEHATPKNSGPSKNSSPSKKAQNVGDSTEEEMDQD